MVEDNTSGLRGPSYSRRRYIKYGGVATAVSLAGCVGDSGSGEEFVIGSNHPLSGSLSYTGETMTQAIELAAQQKNEEGGIEALDGAEVSVLQGDNEGAQEMAGQVTQQLINDGADVVTGCFNSDSTIAASATAEQAQVPFVVSVAATDQVLKGRDMNYVYRLQPTTYHFARDWARYYPELIRNAGYEIETYGHYYIDNAYGAEINEYLENEFGPENDLEMVESTAITLDQNDANAQVARLREADPDCICLSGYEQDAAMFFDALENLNWRPTWLSGSASTPLVNPDAIENIGEPAEGIMDANYALNPANDFTDQFRQEYSDFADRSATPEAGLAWAACQVIFDAVERAGTKDSDALNDAIAETQMDSDETPLALEGIEFEDNGENAHALAAINQVRDGDVKVVYPEDYQEVEPVVEPNET
ncbi:ABC transporter substrate-binding protein (plasmid) [Natrinema zhouii]|uniref:ABC transporter substrate-binding protein n=1 Tax=Natrinema zhouii TaxID=1710539 RepID=UPI001CFF9BB4|nr:ABC transporter substrate-binding protein [Natrinema zhouii]UHQ98843.1 ABC transporter substrate-binding protein [Natrinema zhouii]